MPKVVGSVSWFGTVLRGFGAWAILVVAAAGGVAAWAWVVSRSATRIGGETATVISALSLQVSLLTVFFVMVAFGLAVLAFFQVRTIQQSATQKAASAGRRAALEELQSASTRKSQKLQDQQVEQEDQQREMDSGKPQARGEAL